MEIFGPVVPWATRSPWEICENIPMILKHCGIADRQKKFGLIFAMGIVPAHWPTRRIQTFCCMGHLFYVLCEEL